VAGGISPGGDLGSNYVTNVFDVAKSNGFNIVRVFGHGEETSFELQTAPGVVSLEANSKRYQFPWLGSLFCIAQLSVEEISSCL
jgi:hypothetical protein